VVKAREGEREREREREGERWCGQMGREHSTTTTETERERERERKRPSRELHPNLWDSAGSERRRWKPTTRIRPTNEEERATP